MIGHHEPGDASSPGLMGVTLGVVVSVMSDRQYAPRGRHLVPAGQAAKAQQAVDLANENCDRAMALAHKLAAELRAARDRINELENEADGLVERLRADARSAIMQVEADADARIHRAQRDIDSRVAEETAEVRQQFALVRDELVRTREHADRTQADANARIARIKAEADERVARIKAEADER